MYGAVEEARDAVARLPPSVNTRGAVGIFLTRDTKTKDRLYLSAVHLTVDSDSDKSMENALIVIIELLSVSDSHCGYGQARI